MIPMSSEMEHDHQVTLNVTAAFCVSELILSLRAAGGVALGGRVATTSSSCGMIILYRKLVPSLISLAEILKKAGIIYHL